MKLHNTLTRNIAQLQPINTGRVGVYSCGPTLYDRVHIGNLNSFIVADILNRVLKADGLDVKHVMNFTDVDDKTIRASLDKYPSIAPNEALKQLTRELGDSFMTDIDAVGNDTSSYDFIWATDNIAMMQEIITDLFKLGYAYIAEDGVYFSIEAYQASDKKYGQLLEISSESTSHARIANDEYDKDSAHDFVLWKIQKTGEPAWDYELDGKNLAGRPGWHIECSAMSKKLLGEQFDIHTGGIDLIFPHHENEIAQSTALNQSEVYASIFLHNEHLMVDGKKMSKSLGNFYTLQDLMDKGFDPLAFRMLVLQSHYRNQANFSWDNLRAAQNRLNDYRSLAVLRYQSDHTAYVGTTSSSEVLKGLQGLLSDDLKTPQALEYLSGVSKDTQANLQLHQGLEEFEAMLKGIDELLGLRLMEVQDITHKQKQMIADRLQAKAEQNWEKSDAIRQSLKEQGVELRDNGSGTIWSLA